MVEPNAADQLPSEDETIEDLEAPAESQHEVVGGLRPQCGCYEPCGEITDYTS